MEYTTQQFNHCQATVTHFDNGFTIFYSYTCPKIVKFPDGALYRFTFENSRKDGAITESMTTSKQCNKRLGYNHKTLKPYPLESFERKFFDTRIDKYF